MVESSVSDFVKLASEQYRYRNPDPDIPAQQAVGMAIAVLKWWTALIIKKSGKYRE